MAVLTPVFSVNCVDREEAMGEKQVQVQDAQQSELKIDTFLQYHVLASL